MQVLNCSNCDKLICAGCQFADPDMEASGVIDVHFCDSKCSEEYGENEEIDVGAQDSSAQLSLQPAGEPKTPVELAADQQIDVG